MDTNPIRRQIVHYNSMILPSYRFAINPEAPTELADGFYFMKTPFVAVMTVIQKYALLLPWAGGPNTAGISEWLSEQRSISLTGKLSFVHYAPWPTTSEFALDSGRLP